LLDGLPPAEHLLSDRGYDADWYRDALEDNGIKPCIPSRKGRKIAILHVAARYLKRHKIENSFARLKDWRRVATRYDRCPKVFLSACALAAVVMFWL
jgi:transposase